MGETLIAAYQHQASDGGSPTKLHSRGSYLPIMAHPENVGLASPISPKPAPQNGMRQVERHADFLLCRFRRISMEKASRAARRGVASRDSIVIARNKIEQ
jgi:hypothetical protein